MENKGILAKDELYAWVVANPNKAKEEPEVCLSFLRDVCEVKKCQFKHIQTISNLKNISNVSSTVKGIPFLKKILLRDFNDIGKLQYDRRIRTQIRSASSLRFVEYFEECIFDFQDPVIFADFISRFQKPMNQIISLEETDDPEQVVKISDTHSIPNWTYSRKREFPKSLNLKH